MDQISQLLSNTSRGPYYVAETKHATPVTKPLVRLIAYYLPQFHPIPENDLWWGKGFTEWTNVTKAVPRFQGHYQPHLPTDLGFYDLRLTETLKAQAELAKSYGITGFCIHRYWFNGKTLLDTPLKLILDNKDIDIGFCVNWANENWSRKWDGGDKSVLISQTYSEDDDLAFIAGLEPFLSDDRYIRIDGRPLIMLYRPSLLPDAAATVKRWREYLIGAGYGDPYIVMPQVFDDFDPRRYGMDAAAGFPPHNCNHGLRNEVTEVNLYSPNFAGVVYDYGSMAEGALRNVPSDFTFFPGVCPSWDNEARNPNKALCYRGASPSMYGAWLSVACNNALRNERPDERIVFINAWNEWAEGAHLEPDVHYGHAYLVETAKAIRSLSFANMPKPERASANAIVEGFKLESRDRRKSMAHRLLRRVVKTVVAFLDDLCARSRSWLRRLS